ncbi:MAG TPA: hypothetical protein DCZ72_13775 [Armatimonadetes bacterium]|nr:hypothetical protein [Armatimonadota bacterium]
MAVLGLDIGSDTIKVVEMAGGKGRLKLLNYGVAPTPPGAVQQGDIVNSEEIIDALRNLIKTHKIGSKKVISAVQGQQTVVVRIIKIMRVADKELRDTMNYEVERHIPFSASNFSMDFAVIKRPDEPADSQTMEVLFAAAVDEMLEDHFTTLRGAKLAPVAIDVQPLALSHSLVEGPSGHGGLGETVAVVDIGAVSTDLGVIKDGLLHFPRTIPIGGRSFTQRLSEGLGVSEMQAERLKRQYGSLAALPPELAARLARPARVEEVAEEAPTAPALDFGAGLFDVLDPGDSSDMGFGGLSFGEPTDADDGAPPEVQFDDSAEGTVFELPEATAASTEPFDFGQAGDSIDAAMGDAGSTDDTTVGLDLGEDLASASGTFDFGNLGADAGADDAAGDDDEAESVSFELFDDEEAGPPMAFDLTDDDGPAPTVSGATAGVGGEVDESSPSLSAEPSSPEPAAGESFTFDFDDADMTITPPSPVDLEAEASSEKTGSPLDSGAGFGGLHEPEPALASQPSVLASAGSDVAGSDLGYLLGDSLGGSAAGSFDGADDTLGPEDEERLRVREVLEPVVRDLAQEVARSLEYYQSQNEGAIIDRVVLAGGTARMEGLAEFFEAELHLPTATGRPLEGITLAKGVGEDVDADEALLAVAVGLAMRGLA